MRDGGQGWFVACGAGVAVERNKNIWYKLRVFWYMRLGIGNLEGR